MGWAQGVVFSLVPVSWSRRGTEGLGSGSGVLGSHPRSATDWLWDPEPQFPLLYNDDNDTTLLNGFKLM